MARFSDPGDLRRHIEKALAEQHKLTVVETQRQLGRSEVSPVDTGRFRSSWFASKGNASTEVAPEGTNSPRDDAGGLEVTVRDNVHLTNSLVYATSVAVEGRVVSQPKTWFKTFRDVMIPKIADAAGRSIKQQYDL